MYGFKKSYVSMALLFHLPLAVDFMLCSGIQFEIVSYKPFAINKVFSKALPNIILYGVKLIHIFLIAKYNKESSGKKKKSKEKKAAAAAAAAKRTKARFFDSDSSDSEGEDDVSKKEKAPVRQVVDLCWT